MADVTPRERAQLVLITGLVLAATLVGVALVLNTVMFTENLATRQTTESLDETNQYRQATRESVQTALGQVNTGPTNASHHDLRENFTNALEAREAALRRDAAVQGASVDVSLRTSNGGFRLQQTNAGRDFTAGGTNAGATDWALVEGANGTTPFVMNLSRMSLFEATVDTTLSTLLSNAYHVTVSNDTATWEVYFYQGALTENVYIIADEPGSPLTSGVLVNQLAGTCSYDADFVRIDFQEGEVNGNSCDQLSFYSNVSGPYAVSYNNTETLGIERARGTYKLRANNSSVVRQNYYTVASGNDPFMVSALTASQVEVTYQTSDHWYQGRVGVQPPSYGRFRSSGSRPGVTIDDVVDDTGSLEKYDFEVTASVSDPDGNLQQVRFVLTDDAGSEVANTTVSVSGSSDTVSHRFSGTSLLASLEDDGNFTVHVVVTDTEGLSASAAAKHRADNDGVVDADDVYPSYGGAAGPGVSGAGGNAMARSTPTPDATAVVDETVTETTPVPETDNVTDTEAPVLGGGDA